MLREGDDEDQAEEEARRLAVMLAEDSDETGEDQEDTDKEDQARQDVKIEKEEEEKEEGNEEKGHAEEAGEAGEAGTERTGGDLLAVSPTRGGGTAAAGGVEERYEVSTVQGTAVGMVSPSRGLGSRGGRGGRGGRTPVRKTPQRKRKKGTKKGANMPPPGMCSRFRLLFGSPDEGRESLQDVMFSMQVDLISPRSVVAGRLDLTAGHLIFRGERLGGAGKDTNEASLMAGKGGALSGKDGMWMRDSSTNSCGGCGHTITRGLLRSGKVRREEKRWEEIGRDGGNEGKT